VIIVRLPYKTPLMNRKVLLQYSMNHNLLVRNVYHHSTYIPLIRGNA